MRDYFLEALILFGWYFFDACHKYIIEDRNQVIVQSYTIVYVQMNNQNKITMIPNSLFCFCFQFVAQERSWELGKRIVKKD